MNKILRNPSGNVILELRQNPASAWLTIKKSGRLIDEQDILNLLDMAGIKTGFDEALKYIRENSLERDYDVPFPIAISHQSDSETAVKLVYHYDPNPIKEFFSSKDLGILTGLSYVEQGEVIAAYSNNIFESGNSIYDIFGELIIPAQVDNDAALLLVGDNVAYEATEYTALKTGYPYLDENGRICILDKLSFDASTCMASFRTPLALEIFGDLANCNLVSGSEIMIHGHVRGSSIYCQGDLTVEGNIESCQNPGIQVLGQLKVSSIQSSWVLCKGQLSFHTQILDSTVACDGGIIGDSELSTIVGGLCQAFADIDIASAGDRDGSETEIEIAISPFYRSMLMQMTKELIRLRSDGEAQEIDELQTRIKQCETELDNQLNDFLQRSGTDKRCVRIRSDVFAKTTIRILKHTYQI
ncbi:MAG TPA: FapA family protein, partial [Candidatus Cloacimonadota bacterium]|nr:FapA family protein [Candidatus Cloacimonadota bacterium]